MFDIPVTLAQFPGISQQQLTTVLTWMSHLAMPSIFVLAVLHLLFFVVLWFWYRRDLRNIASALDNFTREVRFRSILDRSSHLCDQIEAFLIDINEVLDKPDRKLDRVSLSQRIHILDEKRAYLHSIGFETSYNIFRTLIEVYPLAGILGTIIAIGVVLQGPQPDGAAQAVVQRFGESIWATFAGLVSAILFMLLNSTIETSFTRLSEDRRLVRDMVFRVKRQLVTPGGESQ